MSLKKGICWCKLDVMAQCTAPDVNHQELCDFWIKHSYANRCSNFNPNLNNHCWSQEAQKFSAEFGVRTMDNPAPIEEEELCIDDFVEEEPEGEFDGRRCDNCILYACSRVIKENQNAAPNGGLTMADLQIIADSCPDYCDDAMINRAFHHPRGRIKP